MCHRNQGAARQVWTQGKSAYVTNGIIARLLSYTLLLDDISQILDLYPDTKWYQSQIIKLYSATIWYQSYVHMNFVGSDETHKLWGLVLCSVWFTYGRCYIRDVVANVHMIEDVNGYQ